MQKLVLILILWWSVAPATHAQVLLQGKYTNPPFGGGVYPTLSQQIQGTPEGKIFVYGTYDPSSDNFDGLMTGNTGKTRFVAAYGSDGQIAWVRGVSNESSFRCSMTYSPTGLLYWGASFVASVQMGTETLTTGAEDQDIAIGRCDTLGNLLGNLQIGTDSTLESLKDVATDAAGNLLVLFITNATGAYMGMNLQTLPDAGLPMILARFSGTGVFLNAVQVGVTQYDFGQFSLAPAPDGDWYIGGFMYSGKVVLGGTEIGEGGSGIVRWNLNSGPVWVSPVLSTSNNCLIQALASDAAGNIAFAGSYIGQLLSGNPRSKTGYYYDVLVGKMDATGQILWSRNGDDGSNGHEIAYAVDMDEAGNVYVTGNSKGGLLFENYGVCDSGPYATSFIARFHADGGFAWANCNGSGTGVDLIVQPDHTVFAVGNTADGVSQYNTNYLNHWANYNLAVQPLPQTHFCTIDTISLNWTFDGPAFPAGSAVYVSLRDSAGVIYSYGYPSTSGNAGVILFEIQDGFSPADQSVFLSVQIGPAHVVRTPDFTVSQSPVPYFSLASYPSCLGIDRRLEPAVQFTPPDLVHWEPASGLSNPDTISILIQNVQAAATYTVFFTDTITGCARSKSISIAPYDFSALVSGPEHVYGIDSYTYHAEPVNGSPYAPLSYQWSGNPNIGPYVPLFIYDTTYVVAKIRDAYGCERTDSLYVEYEPARVLTGHVFNPDSTAALPYTAVEIYRKSNSSGLLTLYTVPVTDPAGYFYEEIRGSDSTILVHVVPDTFLYPHAAPTWFTRKYFVQNAVPVSLAQQNITLPTIRVLDNQMLPDSNGVLGGTIETDLPQFQNSTQPVAGLLIWIADAERQPLQFTVTDQNGVFRFEHLPFGAYYFMVDKMGINNDLAPSITIDAGRPQADALLGTLLADRLNILDMVATQQVSLPATQWEVSPNPFTSGALQLYHPDMAGHALEITFCDAGGRHLFEMNATTDRTGKALIHLPKMNDGIYFLKIKSGNHLFTMKKIVVAQGGK